MNSKRIFRAFKIQGLSIQSDALAHLLREINEEPTLDLNDVIYAIKNSIDQSKMTSTVVNLEALESALTTLLSVSEENNYEQIQVFSSFEIPRLQYNPHKRTFDIDRTEQRSLHSSADCRVQLLRNRFTMIEQRVLRNQNFRAPLVSSSAASEFVQLSNIESLLGTTGTKRIMGMIGQDERKRLYLEDISSSIYIDISNATYTNGLFTVNCTVLVEGEVIDDILHVSSMGFPPPESKKESLDAIGGKDPLGVEVSKQQMDQISLLEKNDQQATFVILSDVHLDNPEVMKNLETLFEGFEPISPPLFVFMGNFTSAPVAVGSISMLDFKEYFDEFLRLILKFPTLVAQSHFVFIPGPSDPGSADVMPRHHLPNICTDSLIAKLPNATIASNPCRIRYYTQDLVIMRENLLHKMRGNCLVPLVEDGSEEHIDISEHLVKTVVDQAHVCPLPLTARPIHWAYDSSLHLFPLPDVVILADKTEQYQWGYCGVAVFNPGPFYNDSSFVVYRPATKATEFSRIN